MLTPLIYDPTIVKYNADLDTVSKVVDYLDKVQAEVVAVFETGV